MPKTKRSAIGGFWLSQRRNSDAWCATWFDRAARQTRRVSLGTSDFREAELRLAAFAIERSRLKDARPDDVPLASILVRYWQEHARHLRSADAERIGLRYWSDHFGEATVAEVTPQAVDRFVAELRSRGLSGSYISRILSPGRAAIQRPHKRGELATVPFISDVPRDPAPERYILAMAEARALLAAAEQEHLLTFLMLAFGTRGRTRKGNPVVPICATLARHLAALPRTIRRGRGGKVIMPTLGPVHRYGKPLGDVGRSFAQAAEAAGLNPTIVTPYSLRHTMAVWLREQAVPEWECAGILGHKLLRTTEIYARFRPDYLGQAAQAVERFLAAASAAPNKPARREVPTLTGPST